MNANSNGRCVTSPGPPRSEHQRGHSHIWATICLPHGRHLPARRGDSDIDSPGHVARIFRNAISEWMSAAKWSARWSKLKGWTDRRTIEQAAKKLLSMHGGGSPHVRDPEGQASIWSTKPGWGRSTSGTPSEVMTCWGKTSHAPNLMMRSGRREREGNTTEGQAPNQLVWLTSRKGDYGGYRLDWKRE